MDWEDSHSGFPWWVLGDNLEVFPCPLYFPPTSLSAFLFLLLKDDTDLALTTPKAEGAVPSEFDGTVMYVRSRARSFAFLQEVADAAKKINIDSAEAFRQLMAGHASAIASTADLSRRMIVR